MNVSLCGLFNGAELRIPLKDVRAETLENVLCWLWHHKGVAPPELEWPVRSVHMHKIVSDPWDALFIDMLPKKAVFELIAAAHYNDGYRIATYVISA